QWCAEAKLAWIMPTRRPKGACERAHRVTDPYGKAEALYKRAESYVVTDIPLRLCFYFVLSKKSLKFVFLYY
ncbi:MAG: hypothetical protein II056_02675, partial [Paludibacteraceae bacterium]|nr:hypothetical protein [Paludibacteraceae bacterium]